MLRIRADPGARGVACRLKQRAPMRTAFLLAAGIAAACRPPGYGKGGGGGDDDTQVDAAAPPMPDAPADGTHAATCTKTFRLDGHSLANAVALTGTFVSWAGTVPPAIAFAKGGDGAWTGSYDFAPGMHQYKYIVDGSWIPDPTNPDQVDDGFGGKNSVITCVP